MNKNEILAKKSQKITLRFLNLFPEICEYFHFFEFWILTVWLAGANHGGTGRLKRTIDNDVWADGSNEVWYQLSLLCPCIFIFLWVLYHGYFFIYIFFHPMSGKFVIWNVLESCENVMEICERSGNVMEICENVMKILS